jgi:hypothetical protein
MIINALDIVKRTDFFKVVILSSLVSFINIRATPDSLIQLYNERKTDSELSKKILKNEIGMTKIVSTLMKVLKDLPVAIVIMENCGTRTKRKTVVIKFSALFMMNLIHLT